MISVARQYPFLQGGGEMGELTRNYNWSQTSIGSPNTWPQSLRTTVSILLNSKFPMFLFWGPDSIQFYNDAYRPSFGIDGKHPAALGSTGAETWQEIWPDIKPQIDQVLAGGEATWHEDQRLLFYRHGRMDFAYWTYSYSPVIGEGGSVEGVFVTCTETTKAVLQKEHLAESEARFRTLVERAVSPVFVLKGYDMVLSMANKPLFDVWQVGQEAIGKPFLEILPEMTDQPFIHWMRQVYSTGEPLSENEVPAHFVRKSGQVDTHYWNFVYQPYREPDGTLSGVLAQATEITEQVLARKAIEASEARFQNLVREASAAIVVLTGKEMRVEIVNEAYARLIQLTPEDLLGRPLFDVIPDARDYYLPLLDKVRQTLEPVSLYDSPYSVVTNGEKIEGFLNIVYEPYRNTSGSAVGVMAILQDVTEQVLSKKRLEESEERLRFALSAGGLGSWELELNTLTLQASEHCKANFGQLAEDPFTYQTLVNCIHPDDRQRQQEAVQATLDTGADYDIEYRVIWPDDSLHWLNIRGRVQYDKDGKPVRMVGVSLDVTERVMAHRRVENLVQERTQQLADANRVLQDINIELQRSNHQLEEFAHAASHDLKEPVRKIQYFVASLHEQLATVLSQEQAFVFGRVTNAAERMGLLIDDLLVYSHVSHDTHQKEDVVLGERINAVLEDLELDIDQKDAVIKIALLPVVQGHRRQLQQLFQNLISNALKYSKANIPPQIGITAATADRHGKAYHLIEVADNGIGFSPEYAEKIFQMFSRLHGKGEYSGTGVGLAIVRKIVENHNGFIEAEGKPGEGSTFRVYLPA